ncbi:MAG: peptide deformylase, partial [Pseudomonadota bacterium]
MAILPIVHLPDPILRRVSKPVERVDDALRTFLDSMLDTMYDAPGIGLAAIQVGEPLRVFTVDCAKRASDENDAETDAPQRG